MRDFWKSGAEERADTSIIGLQQTVSEIIIQEQVLIISSGK